MNNDDKADTLPLPAEVRGGESFPVDLLGHVLSTAAQGIHEIVQCSPGIAAQAVLAGAALATQERANVDIRGRFVCPLSLYVLTLGDSGEKKSKADDWALGPHKSRQKARLEKYRTDMRSRKAQTAASLRRQEKDADATEKQGQLDLSDETILRVPNLLIKEPTYSSIFQTLDVGIPFVGLFSDEGGQFPGGYAMGRDSRTKTATALSDLWGGREISRSRAGEGTHTLYDRAFSTHLMVQARAGA
ncbi:MAG: DUF3987 domain-containing protein [Gammaproteobacteria bacterium]|nr:DUF3987 domain-containing protein [Gammaproteobacteria bacterium]